MDFAARAGFSPADDEIINIFDDGGKNSSENTSFLNDFNGTLFVFDGTADTLLNISLVPTSTTGH